MGITSLLPSIRLIKHNKGDVKSTRHGRPWKIIYVEEYDSYISARRREKQIKSVKFTKNKRPLTLIFVKEFQNYKLALNFEKKVKSWKKRKSIERMLDKPDNICEKYCRIV